MKVNSIPHPPSVAVKKRTLKEKINGNWTQGQLREAIDDVDDGMLMMLMMLRL